MAEKGGIHLEEVGTGNMNTFEHPASFLSNQQEISITKDMLKRLKVIGQVDSKYVASMLGDAEKKLLILLDQHAVDERLRLEQLQRKYRRDLTEGQRSKLAQPLKFKIHFEDEGIEKLSKGCLGFEKELESSGIVCRLKTIHGCVVCKVSEAPMDLLRKIIRRKDHDEYLVYLKNSVRKLIQNAVKMGSPCGNFFAHVMASEACARAVKFGDHLEHSTMVNMLERLGHCDMPFQCAHGRPTLTVINYNSPPSKNTGALPNVNKFMKK